MCAYFAKKTNPKRILRGIYDKLVKAHIIPKKRIKANVKDVVFYHSFNWSVMPYEVIEYIDSFIKNNTEFMKVYRNTYLPEDGFLGTIIMNSKFRENVVRRDDGSFVSLTFRPPLVNHHNPLITSDFVAEIENTETAFFARKFDSDLESNVVEYFHKKVITK